MDKKNEKKLNIILKLLANAPEIIQLSKT